MPVESIKLARAEDLSDSAKQKWGIKEGLVKIVTERNSAAETKIEKVEEKPLDFFKKAFK